MADLAALEAREDALRRRLLGEAAPNSSLRAGSASQATILERVAVLRAQLSDLSAAAGDVGKLAALYEEHRTALELPRASTLALGAPKAGDELKRATILTSADRVEAVAADCARLRQLQRVLDDAPQAQRAVEASRARLEGLERSAELATERALATHARVERLLATYQQMMRVLSEKCVEYNELLEQLHV